jgi:hypothetical protein
MESNLIRQIVLTMQPFTVIENLAFCDLFHSISGFLLPISSVTILKRWMTSKPESERAQLKGLLESQCKSITLSLDAWTSSNQQPPHHPKKNSHYWLLACARFYLSRTYAWVLLVKKYCSIQETYMLQVKLIKFHVNI